MSYSDLIATIGALATIEVAIAIFLRDMLGTYRESANERAMKVLTWSMVVWLMLAMFWAEWAVLSAKGLTLFFRGGVTLSVMGLAILPAISVTLAIAENSRKRAKIESPDLGELEGCQIVMRLVLLVSQSC